MGSIIYLPQTFASFPALGWGHRAGGNLGITRVGCPTASLSLLDASHHPGSTWPLSPPRGSPCRAGKAAQRLQEKEQEEEGWGEAMPDLCQMWERREGGTPFPLLPKPGGDPVPRHAARAGMAGMPPLAPVERDNPGVTPGPRLGLGGGGWVPLATPPALAPLQSRIVPGSAGGGGAGPRASGKAGGKAGAGTCWSRLSCWWSCSSRLPVCPCSSPAARAGCIPRGRSRPALPWRGSWIPPFSFFLFQLHLGWAACRARSIPASRCRRA